MPKLDESLVEEFWKVIQSEAPPGRQKEQVVQDFLEHHTQLIPTRNRLNHHLHLESIISKFPLDTSLVTDYIYLTKSSDVWRITLVELESPDKHIFTQSLSNAVFTSDFQRAIGQVRSWKTFVKQRQSEIINRLKPLIKPARSPENPFEFHYQLIIGRSENKNKTPERKAAFREVVDETRIDILTYDQLMDIYVNDQKYDKLVLQLTGSRFAIKRMHHLPTKILTHLGPDVLDVTKLQKEKLLQNGYEMEKWCNGELLRANIKYALSTFDEEDSSAPVLNLHRKRHD